MARARLVSGPTSQANIESRAASYHVCSTGSGWDLVPNCGLFLCLYSAYIRDVKGMLDGQSSGIGLGNEEDVEEDHRGVVYTRRSCHFTDLQPVLPASCPQYPSFSAPG